MDGLRLVFDENEKYDYGINESFFIKNTHAQNRLFKMLPYTTTGKSRDYVTDFTGVVGELGEQAPIDTETLASSLSTL